MVHTVTDEQTGPTFDVMWGSQPSRPMTATGISAGAATSDLDGDGYSGAQCHPVPLDAPDVALQSQRLLAYDERLRREEVEITQEPGRARPTGRPHRPPMKRQAPEVRERQPHAPLLFDQIADGREFAHPRQQRAKPGMCREPRGAPEIGRRPLDLGIPHQPDIAGQTKPAMLPPQYVDKPLYDDYYRVTAGPRHLVRPGPLIQHRLAKLDVFKGEFEERLDDFVYQVEEFAAFHAWNPVETCRQARTHLRGIALAYIRHTPLPPRDWTELKDPRDLTVAYKAQFRTRQRQKNEDISTYVDALQKLAWPLLDPIAQTKWWLTSSLMD